MIRCGFLSAAERKELVSLVRDGLAEHRLARRANAILLLDDGLSCERVAKVLYLDDDTVEAGGSFMTNAALLALNNSMLEAIRAVSFFGAGGGAEGLRRPNFAPHNA